MRLYAFIATAFLILSIASFSGCSTLEGIKKDINSAAQKLEQVTPDRNPQNLKPSPSAQKEPLPAPTQKTTQKLQETVVIPGVLIYRSDGKFLDYKTREVVDTNTALEMVKEWETEAPKRKEQELIAANEKQNQQVLELGKQVMDNVNKIRLERGSSELIWDDNLYEYSKEHSMAMAQRGSMFHTDMDKSYAENAWQGGGFRWQPTDIVNSWMNSQKHRTWLLCPNLKRIAVGVAYSSNSTYASWTFWRNETTKADWWYQYTPDTPPKWWY